MCLGALSGTKEFRFIVLKPTPNLSRQQTEEKTHQLSPFPSTRNVNTDLLSSLVTEAPTPINNEKRLKRCFKTSRGICNLLITATRGRQVIYLDMIPFFFWKSRTRKDLSTLLNLILDFRKV